MRAKGVLDAGPDLAVGLVVFLLPARQFGLARLAAVRDGQAGSSVAAVGDDRGAADGILGPGHLPRLAVVAVAGSGPADSDDQAGVGVDDDLVVGGVPVVLRLLGHGVAPGQHGVLAEPLARLQREQRAQVVDDPARGGLGDTEQRGELPQGEVGAPVGGDQHDPVL